MKPFRYYELLVQGFEVENGAPLIVLIWVLDRSNS